MSAAALIDALARFDASAKDCPARKQFLGYSPCPKCRATPRDGCGLEIVAAYTFVEDVRSVVIGEVQG
jgi:hypothetical protein